MHSLKPGVKIGFMEKKGVTLIELVITAVALSILATLVFIALDPYRSVRLQSATSKLSLDLLYVRNLALSTAKWYGISFDADPVNTYTVYQTDGVADTVITDPSRPGEDFVIDINDYYNGVVISGLILGGGSKLEFDPLGTPFDDRLGLAFTREVAVVLSYRTLSREVRVAPETGRIFIQ